MAVNKVVYNRQTLVDLTSDTVKAENLLKGCTAHQADGTIITGTLFEGYPAMYYVYETLQDSLGCDITDRTGNVIQGRTAYKKV